MAALLAYSGIKGAVLNIKINTKYIKDVIFVKDIERKYKKIDKNGEILKNDVLKIVEEFL